MPSPRLFYALVALHWGFVVRIQGATAAQIALALAPPTTVVGAFTAPLLRILGFREGIIMTAGKAKIEGAFSQVFECILKATIAASMGLHPRSEGPGIAVIMELSRLIAVPYKTGGERQSFKVSPWSQEFYSKAITKALPVQAVGTAYGPSTLVDLVWVVDVEKLARCLPEGRVRVEDIDGIGLHASYGVTRIGSKEGICSTIAACYVKEPTMINVGEIFTAHTYVPVDCVAPSQYELVSKVQMWDLRYAAIEYYVPSKVTLTLAYPPPDNQIALPAYRLKSGCKAYHIKLERLQECEGLKNMKSVEWAAAVAPGAPG